MSLKIVVLAKQVPDTRNVGKDAMKADGTINRAALPAIFNPEDLNALEQALRLKDAFPGSTVTLLTMGPGRAAEIIREGLFRGADGGYLLTDRAFAGADTLATSYAIATAIRKIGEYDIILGGRQAIDGDTAQVGPQVAEKLGLNQITYVEEVLEMDDIRKYIFNPDAMKSLTVKDLMHNPVDYVLEDERMDSVMRKFDRTDCWRLPVVTKEGIYLGFISRSRILAAYRDELKMITVED